MLLYILFIFAGAAIIVLGIKKNKLLIILGAIIAAFGVFLTAAAIILMYAVRSQEPDPDPNEIAGVEDGQDWRAWRSYSDDFTVCEGVEVCLSPLDDGKGYAAYDSCSGSRVGTLFADGTNGQEEILCEDVDSDGMKEIGIVMSQETAWYHYTDEEWIEGEGGGCFRRIE